MKDRRFILLGGLLAPPAVLILFLFPWLGLFICPHAWLVLAVRGWFHAPTTIYLPGTVEVAIAFAYYPLMGFALTRASQDAERMIQTRRRILVWHVIFVVLAYFSWTTLQQLCYGAR